MRDYMRRVIFKPYRSGPNFTLTLFDAAHRNGRERVRYRLTKGRKILFEGDDFGPSPLYAVDSDASVAALMEFLTLRPGDTDAEYFAGYTDVQRKFCEEHAEALGFEASQRFPEE